MFLLNMRAVFMLQILFGLGLAQELGVNPPFELDVLQKFYYPRKGDKLFSHTFCMLICDFNANNME